MLELAYRADSNSAARKGLWVRVPPAVPPDPFALDCRAIPMDQARCIQVGDLTGAYVYLLGLYLGDGMLSIGRRNVWRLRITLDRRYPGIVAEAGAAISTLTRSRVGHVAKPGCVDVNAYWKHWSCVFPQHGPGPKHERSIRLLPWQVSAIEVDPRPLIRGLVHSDGCRCINRVKGHEYPRYFFSNLSAEIRELFAWACSLIDVESRPDGARNISVARRDSVAILDSFVGPKH